MADVEENMEEVAVEQEEQAKAEDTPVADDEAQSTTVGGVTMDEGMCAHMIYCLFVVHGRGVIYSVSSLQNLIIDMSQFLLMNYTTANMIYDALYFSTSHHRRNSTTSFGYRSSCKYYPSHRYRCRVQLVI